MIESYCYIDFSKNSSKKLYVDRDYPFYEISVTTTYATLYFSISKDSKKTALLEDEDMVLLFEGEIFGKDSIKSLFNQLKKDTLKDVLNRVDGLFTLVVYDKKSEKLYLSRDYFGQLFLYYYYLDDTILFTNSLKVFKKSNIFKREIDVDVLGQYFQHGYILEPNTIFSNCFKVSSSSIVEIDLVTQKKSQKRYWNIAYFYDLPRLKLPEKEVIDKSLQLLSLAIAKQINSAKNIGVFLSGGYDSSALASIISKMKPKKLQAYTVGFENKEIDEVLDAKKIAEYLHIQHNSYYFSDKYLKELLENFAFVYDEPIADKAALPTMLICKEADKNIEMIFGGEGGDEVFASAGIIKRLKLLNSMPFGVRWIASRGLKLFPTSTKYTKWSKILAEKKIENSIKYENITLHFHEVERLIKQPIKRKDIYFDGVDFSKDAHYLDRLFPLILKSYVSNNLLPKVYFAAKFYNLEVKAPYLDKSFVEFLAKVDISLKHKGGVNKYILKKILQKYLPTKLIDRPKKGFEVPVAKMLKNELRFFLDSYINKDRIEKEGILDAKEVMRLKEKFLDSNSYYDEQNIWNILIFQLWYEEWFRKR